MIALSRFDEIILLASPPSSRRFANIKAGESAVVAAFLSPKSNNLGWLSACAVANLDLFDVDVLRIGFSASLVVAGVSAEAVQRLAEGWLEFARKRSDEPQSSQDHARRPGSGGESHGQRQLSDPSAWRSPR